jgi:hypothetical protein
MSTARAVILFAIGLLLAVLVFPVAFFVSAALGYVFGVIALAIGVWLAVKRAGGTLPLVLGVVLVVIAVISIAGTAFIHMAVYSVSKAVESVSKAVEEAVETKHVSGVIGQAVTVGNWEITVLGVKEAKYLKRDDSYYAAEEGQKAVVVTLRIKNIGKETKTPDIWNFVMVTNANKSYEDKSVYSFKYLLSRDVTEEVKRNAVTVNMLRTFAPIAPGTQMEGDILFAIPQNEEPQRLHFKVGITTEVIIRLR